MITPFWKQDKIENYKKTLNIILLAHVQQPRGHINQAQLQCSGTERFSIEEFNQIYQGIVGAGYYIQAVYFNELDFIEEYTKHPERFVDCLIYNLARNGFGNNKKTIIPAFCELVGLNYSTSTSLTSALCRNKYYFSILLQTHGIPTPRSWLLTEAGTWQDNVPPEGTVIICKPCSESASQGVNNTSIFRFSSKRFEPFHRPNYMVQEYIDGAECEVPVLSIRGTPTALPPVGINLYGNKILDEKASANNHYGFYALEDTQTKATIDAIKKYAEESFQLLQMDVYGRIDFRIDANGNPYVFDVSTTPYTTEHSSFAFDFNNLGFDYNDIYQAIIASALLRSKGLER
ncbi:hypothetical protein [Desulfotomaculum sp. 1211_IL3151]|uniref:hypothetical protein n=1 Tax=Desulfotomaculum sp. 1211_IL3151 TaxID=3084055 RepID=UPI002FD8B501